MTTPNPSSSSTGTAPHPPQDPRLGTTSFDPHTSAPRSALNKPNGIAGAARKSSSIAPLAVFVAVSAGVAGYFVASKWQRSGDRAHPTQPEKNRTPEAAKQSPALEKSGKVVTPAAQRMHDNARDHA